MLEAARLGVGLYGDVQGFRSDMDAMARSAQQSMEEIRRISDNAAKSLQGIEDIAKRTDFDSYGEKISFAVGRGVGEAQRIAKEGFEAMRQDVEQKSKLMAIAVGAAFAVVGLGAVYAAYRVVKSSTEFIGGLFTGASYKTESIAAVQAITKEVNTLRTGLQLTSIEAGALGEALKASGTTSESYTSVQQAVTTALRDQKEKLDYLKVSYKDTSGAQLSNGQVLENVKKRLEEYTEGYDRNAAAAYLGVGSYVAVSAAAAVTADKIQAARSRLIDYNLAIGEGSQEAVKQYEGAMRGFDREMELMSQGIKKAWADNTMPILTELAVFFKDGFPVAVNAFRYSMATVTTLFYGLKTSIYAVAETALATFENIGSALVTMGAASAMALTGQFGTAKTVLLQGADDIRARWKLAFDNITAQARNNKDAMALAWGADSLLGNDTKRAAVGKAFVAPPAKDETVAQSTREWETFLRSLEEKIAHTRGNVMQEFDIMKKHAAELNARNPNPAKFAEAGKQIGVLQDEVIFKRNLEAFKASFEAVAAARAEANQQMQQGAIADKLYIDDLVFQTSLLGKTAEAQRILTEDRRVELETIRRIRAMPAFQTEDGPGLSVEEWRDRVAAIRNWGEAQKKVVRETSETMQTTARSWGVGAQQAFNDYLDYAANAATQARNLYVDAFRSMEDALVSFTQTGKLNFKNLADSIIGNLVRIQIQESVTVPAARYLKESGGFFGAVQNFLRGPDTSSVRPGEYGAAVAGLPGYASGIDYVPHDMVARLHEGERVVTKADNAAGDSDGITIYADMRGASVEAVASLRQFVLQINGSIEQRSIAAMSAVRNQRLGRS